MKVCKKCVKYALHSAARTTASKFPLLQILLSLLPYLSTWMSCNYWLFYVIWYINFTINKMAYDLKKQKASTWIHNTKKRRRISPPRCPIGRGWYLRINTISNPANKFLRLKHPQIINIQKTNNNQLNNTHKNNNHIFLFFVPIKTIISKQPCPTNSKENKSNY